MISSLLSKARVVAARTFGRGEALERAKARNQARAIARENARRSRAIGTQAPQHRGTFTGGGPGGVF
jgi:hypothetical protein